MWNLEYVDPGDSMAYIEGSYQFRVYCEFKAPFLLDNAIKEVVRLQGGLYFEQTSWNEVFEVPYEHTDIDETKSTEVNYRTIFMVLKWLDDNNKLTIDFHELSNR